MKVLFDVTHLLHSGIEKSENYLLNGLIPAMLQIQQKYGADVEFLNLYFGQNYSYLPGFIKKNKLHSFMFPKKLLHLLWSNFSFPDLKNFFGKFDIVHSPYYSIPVYAGAEKILTIQDIKFFISDEPKASCITPLFQKNQLLRKNIYNASQIITSSNFTKNEIVSNFNIKPEIISVVYNGMDNPQRIDLHDELIYLRLQGIQKFKYIFLPNASYFSHSILKQIVNTFNKSNAAKNFKLALGFCAGDAGADTFSEKNILPKTVCVKISNPIEENVLFNNSLFVTYTPEYDGSGLSLIKAFSFGKAVISSDSSALSEIAGDAACTVDPNSEDEFINAFNNLLNLESRKKFERKAKKRSVNFSWSKMAAGYFQVYNKSLQFNNSLK